jgi:hypothetical protein
LATNFGQLKLYIKSRLNIENNATFDGYAFDRAVNLSLGSLDEILATNYEDYHLTTYLATLPSQTGNYIPIPENFFKLRGVDFGSPGNWITIFGFGLQQRNYFNSPYSNMYANYGNQVQRKARVMDEWIVIEPMNLCSGLYQIWYTPKFTPLVNDTDVLPYDMDTEGFIEYAVAATGIKVYQKLLLPTDTFEKQVAYYEDKVRNSSKNRNNSGPKTMQNVRNRGRGGGGWGFGSGGFGGL